MRCHRGDLIRRWADERGIKVVHLARVIRVTRLRLHHILSGRTEADMDTWYRLADYVGLLRSHVRTEGNAAKELACLHAMEDAP